VKSEPAHIEPERPPQCAISLPVSFEARSDPPARGFDALVGASVHDYNDEAEVERFVLPVSALDSLDTSRR
jgi:hypothetical protein